MKAPLRFLFGWVLYVALFAAINPVTSAVFRVMEHQPLGVSVVSVTLALVALIAAFLLFLRRFWRWADQPRVSTQGRSVAGPTTTAMEIDQ